jgi:hypothetical protein
MLPLCGKRAYHFTKFGINLQVGNGKIKFYSQQIVCYCNLVNARLAETADKEAEAKPAPECQCELCVPSILEQPAINWDLGLTEDRLPELARN